MSKNDTSGQYQVMDPLSEDAYRALKADIEANGVRVPVAIDEHGTVIDGNHRVRACEELGIEDYPVRVHGGLTEDEKRELAWRLNMQRRHLGDETKRQQVKAYLRRDWDGESEREVAELLGVGQKTVNRAKSELKASGKLSQVTHLSTGEKRERVREYIREHPEASNRAVAEAVEFPVSHPTVGDVREHMDDTAEETETDAGTEADGTSDETDADAAPTDARATTAEEREQVTELFDAAKRGDETAQRELENHAAGEKTISDAHETWGRERTENSRDAASEDTAATGDNDIGQFTSQQTDEWSSPRRVVEPIADVLGGFDVDPCSGAEQSPFADECYTEDDDGLEQPWHGDVWVNPPYSAVSDWVEKAIGESADAHGGAERVVFLCKGDSSTQWWQSAIDHATLVCAVEGRLSFGDGTNAAPFPSHIFVFGIVTDPLAEALASLGTVLTAGQGGEWPMTTPTRRARKLVAAFIREFGWDVSPARRTIEYWSPDAAIPQLHCRKAGRTPQLVAVVFKTEPWEYGVANQLRHGIGKDLWQGYHNAEQSAGLPVWLFVHEGKSGALLRARRSELVVAQELAAADSNGAYDEDMVFFVRDEFDVLTTDAGETGQQHLVVEEVDSAFGEDDEPGGQSSLVGFGG